MTDTRAPQLDPTEFGPNMWLIDEMYRQFLDDPESVSEAWQEFFEDYQAPFGGIEEDRAVEASPNPTAVTAKTPAASRESPNEKTSEKAMRRPATRPHLPKSRL